MSDTLQGSAIELPTRKSPKPCNEVTGNSESLAVGNCVPKVNAGRYEVSIDDFSKFKSIFGSLNTERRFTFKDEFHVTLLFVKQSLANYINKGSQPPKVDVEAAVDSTHSTGEKYTSEAYRKAASLFRKLKNKPVELKLRYVAWNSRVVAVRVDFIDEIVPYFDVTSHISIAKVKEAEFRESDSLVREVDRIMKAGGKSEGEFQWKELADIETVYGKVAFRPHRLK